jgi:hypothetical protein
MEANPRPKKASKGLPRNWVSDSLIQLLLSGLVLCCAGKIRRQQRSTIGLSAIWPHHRTVWTCPYRACPVPSKLQDHDPQRIIAILTSTAIGHVPLPILYAHTNWPRIGDIPNFGKSGTCSKLAHIGEQRLCATAHTNCSKPGLARLHRAESPTRMPSLTCRAHPFEGRKKRQKNFFRADDCELLHVRPERNRLACDRWEFNRPGFRQAPPGRLILSPAA